MRERTRTQGGVSLCDSHHTLSHFHTFHTVPQTSDMSAFNKTPALSGAGFGQSCWSAREGAHQLVTQTLPGYLRARKLPSSPVALPEIDTSLSGNVIGILEFVVCYAIVYIEDGDEDP